jgi:hypothetical protein
MGHLLPSVYPVENLFRYFGAGKCRLSFLSKNLKNLPPLPGVQHVCHVEFVFLYIFQPGKPDCCRFPSCILPIRRDLPVFAGLIFFSSE